MLHMTDALLEAGSLGELGPFALRRGEDVRVVHRVDHQFHVATIVKGWKSPFGKNRLHVFAVHAHVAEEAREHPQEFVGRHRGGVRSVWLLCVVQRPLVQRPKLLDVPFRAIDEFEKGLLFFLP